MRKDPGTYSSAAMGLALRSPWPHQPRSPAALTHGSWTALHFAAEKGRHDAIALLVKHGADSAARNARG